MKLENYIFKLNMKKVTIQNKKVAEKDDYCIEILNEEREIDKFEEENNFKEKIIRILDRKRNGEA